MDEAADNTAEGKFAAGLAVESDVGKLHHVEEVPSGRFSSPRTANHSVIANRMKHPIRAKSTRFQQPASAGNGEHR